MIFQKIMQYRNLIILLLIAFLIIWFDPAVYFVNKAHERAAIQNKIRIKQAETERQIAIIKARTEVELARIYNK